MEGVVQFILENQNILGVLALGASAAVEYIFPPFPGDTVTVLGAVLVGAGNLDFLTVLVALTLGSLLGAAGDYALGYLVLRGRGRLRARGKKVGAIGRQVDRVVERFRRHGEIYILVNRFLPGIRGVFFYAAALSRMRFWRVMLFAAVSALAWNLLLMMVGISLGANFDTLRTLFERYALISWSALGVVALLALVRWLYKRRRGPEQDAEEAPGGEGSGESGS